jgi:Uncharacterised protein family (UPF0175)
MTATLAIDFPTTLSLHAVNRTAVAQRSRFLLALKYFELGEVTSGQAAKMCGMGRVSFLAEAGRCGTPAVELSAEELQEEFSNV